MKTLALGRRRKYEEPGKYLPANVRLAEKFLPDSSISIYTYFPSMSGFWHIYFLYRQLIKS
jgi:hypothetical protein